MSGSPQPHDLTRGILLITAAFFCAAVMSAFSKAALGVSPLLLLFLQYGISFLVFAPASLKEGTKMLQTDCLGLQIFRSVAGSVCQLLFFFAVQKISLMDSVLLSNAAPLFIPLVVWVWLHKSVQPMVWVSLLIGLLGICLIIKPGPDLLSKPASLIALTAAVFSAIALVATNKLSETEPSLRILFYNFGVSTVLLAPVCFFVWKMPSSSQWLLLLGVGGFYAATQYLIILAYRQASAAEISPFNYTVVIFSGILGWVFFGDVPDWISVAGTLLICAGGILCIKAGHPEGQGHSFGSSHIGPSPALPGKPAA